MHCDTHNNCMHGCINEANRIKISIVSNVQEFDERPNL